MLDLSIFAEALRGADGQLRQEAGPDALIHVANQLSSVFMVQSAADGTQAGTLARVGAHGGGIVSVVSLPRLFRVREITHHGEEFFLAGADGRTVHGTPNQLVASPKLLDEKVNPRFQEQLDEILLGTHLLPDREVAGLDAPKTNQLVSGPEVEEIVRVGEAWVAFNGEEVWLTFDNAWPEKIVELLPHARQLLGSLDRLGREGAEFLWSTGATGDESEAEKTEFTEAAAPTSVVVYLTGDFEIHFEGLSGTEFYLDGYWPVVQFRADGTPVDHYVDA